MNPNMLMQMMQNMGINPSESTDDYQDPSHLPPPLDMMYLIRPVLPQREQRFIDILIKMHELQILFEEMQSEV